jgi:diguanylate cyclase (GGDEF)-like protein
VADTAAAPIAPHPDATIDPVGPMHAEAQTSTTMEDPPVQVEDILVVDDSPTMARLLEMGLTKAGFSVRVAHDGGAAFDMATARVPDLVLADVMMPVLDGVELTEHLRADPRTASTTIILVTAKGQSGAKLEGFEAGADDYIVKPFDIDELLARVKGALRRARVLRAESPLTRLPGNEMIQSEIARRVRRKATFSLLYVDLDNFKAYNDKYGFIEGDRVIQFTATVLREAMMSVGGPEAFVGHVGGDDFVLLTQFGREHTLAQTIVTRFDTAILEMYCEEDRKRGYIETTSRRGELQRFPIVSISIGIATTERRSYEHYAQVVAIATEMKTFMKKTPGSSWAVDARST